MALVRRIAPLDPQESVDRMWIAGHTSTGNTSLQQLWQMVTPDPSGHRLVIPPGDRVHYVARILLSGHWSIGRHAHETFLIDGVSRACSHQLVRHNVGIGWTQRSQRYVEFEPDQGFVVPPEVESSVASRFLFYVTMKATALDYEQLRDQGVLKEDARYVLPNAAQTALTGTFSWQAIHNFCADRLCTLAQWEIRHVARDLRAEMVRSYPWAAPFFTVKCIRDGACRELRNKDGRCKVRPYANPAEAALEKTLARLET